MVYGRIEEQADDDHHEPDHHDDHPEAVHRLLVHGHPMPPMYLTRAPDSLLTRSLIILA
jgi:hypothetical protein